MPSLGVVTIAAAPRAVVGVATGKAVPVLTVSGDSGRVELRLKYGPLGLPVGWQVAQLVHKTTIVESSIHPKNRAMEPLPPASPADFALAWSGGAGFHVARAALPQSASPSTLTTTQRNLFELDVAPRTPWPSVDSVRDSLLAVLPAAAVVGITPTEVKFKATSDAVNTVQEWAASSLSLLPEVQAALVEGIASVFGPAGAAAGGKSRCSTPRRRRQTPRRTRSKSRTRVSARSRSTRGK